MSIHVEEGGKIRCVIPDRTINDLLQQKFEQPAEPAIVNEVIEVNEIVAETKQEKTAVKLFKPASSCIKDNLNQLNLS